MPAAEFDQLEPSEFAELWKVWKKREQRMDYRAGVVACLIANAHRDPKTTRPFGLDDFFESLAHFRPEPPTPEDLWGKIEVALGVKET